MKAATTKHTAFAVAFFAFMFLVVEICGRDTTSLLRPGTKKWFDRAYHAIGVALFVAPGLALFTAYASGEWDSKIFYIEWLCVWVFAFYWAMKSAEFHITSAEKRAAKGEVKKVEGLGLAPANAAVNPGVAGVD